MRLLLSTLLPLAAAAPNCAYNGPAYPKPTALTSDPIIADAAANLTATFADLLANETTVVVANNSWSLEAFSVHDEEPFWTGYHTALNLEEVNSTGTREVGADSVYRLGSLTKIFTVLTWFVEAGDEHWHTPITRFVPELQGLGERARADPVRYVDWEAITIGALAGQMAGIPRDYALLGELTQTFGESLVGVGFPPPDELPETPTCGIFPLCNRTAFFEGLGDTMPSFPAEQSPAYSNVAYILLAYALEEISGKDWLSLLTDNVLEPLGLESTYYTTPNDTSNGVIPGNMSTVGWTNRLGDEGPAGSMFSSSSDLTRLSKSILSSSLIAPQITARWLRPTTFTSDPAAALGAPWGLRRINMGRPYHWTTGYQKAGMIADYSALMILLPDYDVGFSLLTAGDMPVNMNFDFADAMGGLLLPAVHSVAREQARRFAGTYGLAGSTNSSITVEVDDAAGLSVTRWVSNGTDMAATAVMLHLSSGGPVEPRIRLFPSGLETELEGGGKRIAFRATFEDEGAGAREGRLFSTDCASWLTVGSIAWGARALDEFVFEVDGAGEVVSVEPVALRAVLVKGEGEGGDGEEEVGGGDGEDGGEEDGEAGEDGEEEGGVGDEDGEEEGGVGDEDGVEEGDDNDDGEVDEPAEEEAGSDEGMNIAGRSWRWR